jgi:HK97 family phage portal protein
VRLFGFEVTIRRKQPTLPSNYYSGYGTGGWWPIVREPFTGAWQRNMELRGDGLYHAVYACITLIASDVAKCRLRLVEEIEPDIWQEVRDINSPFMPVMRKPNVYQNRIQFFENWVTSKLITGNTYVLKARDERGIVTDLYVLDPVRTKPLVAPDGEVFYQVTRDNLAGVQQDQVVVPASEIIHDMMSLRYHPLCGIPPMAPAALAATHGLNIQRSAITLFANDSRPGGFLTAPGAMNQETVDRLKADWESQFTGANRGRIAILPNALEWKPMVQNAVDAQLIEQLGMTGKMVCSSFGVPPYKVQIGDAPSHANVGALNTAYYTDCLQKHLEAIELALDEGLGLTNVAGKRYGTEFDTDSLMRMDTATMLKALSDGVRGGFLAPNEARRRLGYKAVVGGDSPMMQHQDYSLEALAKRDAKDDPFASAAAAPAQASEDDEPDEDEDIEAARTLLRLELKQQLQLESFIERIEGDIAAAA